MQNIQIIGYLGADAQVNQNNGNPFTTFRVCVSARQKVDGVWQEVPQWYSCLLHGANTNLLQYMVKGKLVYVSGEPSYSMYDSIKYRTKVIDVTIHVRSIELLAGGGETAPAAPAGAQPDVSNENAPF